jgi:hypothetical protein
MYEWTNIAKIWVGSGNPCKKSIQTSSMFFITLEMGKNTNSLNLPHFMSANPVILHLSFMLSPPLKIGMWQGLSQGSMDPINTLQRRIDNTTFNNLPTYELF